MNVYIAGKFASRFRLRAMRDVVREMGFTCESGWMDHEDGDYPVPRERALVEGQKDLQQVQRADIFIIDTLDESATGGREFEMGFFYRTSALTPTKVVVLVGPVRHIFHELADRMFASWDEAIGKLRGLRQS